MTEFEAREIEGKGAFWFSFYYGRTEIGILHEHQDKWYFIKNWREWLQLGANDEFLQDPKHAEVVLPSMIKKLDQGIIHDSPKYDSSVTTSDYDEVILIVLGAGASYDFCGGKIKLPLTNQLFSDEFAELRSLYPGAAQLYSDLAEVKNLEDYFQRKWKLITKSYNPSLLKSIISIQFYLQHLLLRLSVFHHHNTPNYYSALIQQMRDYICLRNNRVRFAVVNFNYDILFEQELTKVMNYNFNSITDYDNPKHAISVIKVHGSANWCRYFKSPSNQQRLKKFSELSNIQTKCDFLPDILSKLESEISVMSESILEFEKHGFKIDTPLDFIVDKKYGGDRCAQFYDNRQFLPHLLIPYASKDDFMVPPYQISRLETMLEKCSRAYCIGWKGNEKKFIDLIEPLNLEYTWITGASGQDEILNSEAKRLDKSKHRYWTNGFSGAMKHVRDEMENMFDGKIAIGVNHG